MEETALVTAISTLGFPAIVSMYLLVRYSKLLEELTKQTCELATTLESLKNEVGEIKREMRGEKK